MNQTIIKRFEMFRRVRDFCLNNKSIINVSDYAAVLIEDINKLIEEFDQQASFKTEGTNTFRQSTSNKASLRESIREDMSVVRKTARAISLDITSVSEKFRIPNRASDEMLLVYAKSYLAESKDLKEEFAKYGLSEDFFDEMSESIETFEEMISKQNSGKESQMNATAAIDDIVERGMAIVVRLDTFITNRFRSDRGILSSWAGARHIERVARPQKQDNPSKAVDTKDNNGS